MERTGFLTIVSSLQERQVGLPEVLEPQRGKGVSQCRVAGSRAYFSRWSLRWPWPESSAARRARGGASRVPIVPTIAPLASIYVDANTGSDTTGNGSLTKPYKTLTKAVEVLTSAKSFSPTGVVITLASGDYDAANGEKFPIVIPTNVTITGMNFGSGPKSGSFINGLGEDTIFEAHRSRAGAHRLHDA